MYFGGANLQTHLHVSTSVLWAFRAAHFSWCAIQTKYLIKTLSTTLGLSTVFKKYRSSAPNKL